MVHRPADARLLANLLVHEKDYVKQLLVVANSSHSSLASLAAYATASPPSIAQVLLAVTGALASADNALQCYAISVRDWRQQLKALKDLEDEVGNIVRDREIFITRLIKSSKSQKSPNRDSIHVLPSSSASTASLKSDISFTPAHKLTPAQSELLACEAQLAAKERELWECRTRTIREGLSARCSSMVECGRAWGECGNEVLRLLESITSDIGSSTDVAQHFSFDSDPSMAVISTSTPPRKYPPITMPRLSSDLNSLSTATTQEDDIGPTRNNTRSKNTNTNSHTDTDADHSTSFNNTRLQILPAHSISEFVFPTSEFTLPAPPSPATAPVPMAVFSQLPRVLPHRITEEDLHRNFSAEEEGSSIEDVGPLQIIENPQFTARPPSTRSHDDLEDSKRFSIRSVTNLESSNPNPVSRKQEKRVRKASASLMPTGSRFFGSLRLRQLFRRDSAEGGDGGSDGSLKAKKWTNRTDRNLKKMKAGEKGDSSDEGTIVRPPSPPTDGDGATRRLKKKNKKRRARREVGGSHDVSPKGNENGAESSREGGHRELVSDGGLPIVRSHDDGAGAGDKKKLIRTLSKNQRAGTLKEGVEGRLATSVDKMQGTENNVPGRRMSVDVVTPGAERARAHSEETSKRGRRAVSLDERSISVVPPHSRLQSMLPSAREGAGPVVTKNGRQSGRNGTLTRSTMGQPDMGAGSTSLMSIVEGVARQNREDWAKYVESQEGSNANDGVWSGVGQQFGNGLVMVKAPGPVSRDELNAVAVKKTPSVQTHHPASRSAPSLISSGVGGLNGNASPVKPSLGATGTTKGPLRSALRNASRTPSPLPLFALSLGSGGAENGRAVSSTGDNGGGKRRSVLLPESGRESDGDEASESSYETGHEMFDEDERLGRDNTGRDRSLPPPPPPDKPSQLSTIRTVDEKLPSGLDLGVSTQSTDVVAVGDADVIPVRRKSVRVSLQPTFSSTPPALEDDALSSPWSGRIDGGGWQSRVKYPRGDGDVWEDSSEEDEEYQRARRLLISKMR